MKKLAALLLSAVVIALTSIFAFSAPASAATTCSGSQVDSGYTENHKARWVLYYNSSTGKNCARLNAYGSGVGHIDGMSISIQACRTKNVGTCGDFVTNEGPFHSYAGPVSVYARGKCVALYYEVSMDDNTRSEAPVGPFHCG